MLTATRTAVGRAKALCRAITQIDDKLAHEQLVAAVLAGAGVPAVDGRDGTPQTLVWLAQDGAEPWGAAIVKGSQVVTVLPRGSARRLLRMSRRFNLDAAALRREDAADEATLLRYRSIGIAGIEAVEIMRDGTARYVLSRETGSEGQT